MGKPSSRKFDLWRTLIALLPCLLFLPELTGYSRFAGWDVTRLNLPLKWHDVESLREGVLPLWNHLLYAGMPQLAESESGLFYPGNFPLHLPADFFYLAGLTYILHFVLAGFFMDLWLRGRSVRPFASFIGAVLFQTAPFLLFHITSMALLQSIVWFPFILWLADRFLDAGDDRQRRLYAGFIALTGGILMTIGSAQMAFYQGFLLFWYLVGYIFSSKINRTKAAINSVFIIVSMILGAGIIGAAIWIPAMEFSTGTVREITTRSFYFLGSSWLNPMRLAGIFYFPAYGKQTEIVGWASSLMYVGLLPTVFAFLRLAGIRINWKKDAPLIIMGALALFLAFGMLNPVNHVLIKFPPFSLFRYQGRMALGVLIALIGLATSYISDRAGIEDSPAGSAVIEKKTLFGTLAVIFILYLGFILTAARSEAVLTGGIVLAVDILLTWFAVSVFTRKPKGLFPLVAGIYIVFHLLIVFPVGRLATMPAENFNRSFEFFSELSREDGQPARLLVADVGRFADRDLLAFNRLAPQTHLPNFCAGSAGTFRNVQSMDPYTPLRPVEWHRIIREFIGTGFSESSESGTLDRKTARWLQLLGIDAVVTSGGVTEIPGFRRSDMDMGLYFSDDARLFVTQTVQPRAWYVPGPGTGYVHSEAEWDNPPRGDVALDRFIEYTGEHSDIFEGNGWFAGTDGYFFTNGRENQVVGNIDLSTGRNLATVEVDVNAPGWVIVEISYDPGWTVVRRSGDSDPVELKPYRANATFCAVPVGEAGTYTLEFIYTPPSFKKGITGSLAGLILLAIWFSACIPRGKPESILP